MYNRSTMIRTMLGLGLGLSACDDPSSRADGSDDPMRHPPGDSSDPDGDSTPSGDPGQPTAGDPAALEPLSPDQVHAYLARVAPVVAGRSLRFDETKMIEQIGEDAIEPLLSDWVAAPGFAEAIRYLVQQEMNTSGQRDGVDFELPGNRAAEIAGESLPWSTILTADYCVDADGEHIDCDTGAPYAAGVLATRAYLISNKGRFNLGRAKLMLEAFACRVYPMETQIQPPLVKPTLIPMFRAETQDEQTVEEAEGGFGNGAGCYTCHSQFGAHAQLFVKFDADGVWREDATGLQDPEDELGRSFDGLYTSHMFDPQEAAEERSQVFGEEVEDLRGAGEVIADSELFGQCTVKNLIAHAFELKAGASDDISQDLVDDLAARVASQSDPSIDEYVVEVFTDARVIRAVVAPRASE